MVSATLSFKPMEVKKVPSTSNQTTPNSKKRKLSNDGAVVHPLKKTPRRSEEFICRKSHSEDKENAEVSSSSEADVSTVIGENKNDTKKVGLLDKFVRTTQQQEISTSSSEEVIMLDDECNQEPVSTSLTVPIDTNCSMDSSAGDNTCSKEQTAGSVQSTPSENLVENSDCKAIKKTLVIPIKKHRPLTETENNNVIGNRETDSTETDIAKTDDKIIQQDLNKSQDMGLNNSSELDTSVVSEGNTSVLSNDLKNEEATSEATPAKTSSPGTTNQKTTKKVRFSLFEVLQCLTMLMI